MDLSLEGTKFLDSFENLCSKEIDPFGKNRLNLFMLNTNANEFDYLGFSNNLLEAVSCYAVSRLVREKYIREKRYNELSKKARKEFRDYTSNNGELGELILYCFLEQHLLAPKILTKLELKTSTSNYVNGSDGIHFLQMPNGNYQIIFGESKTIKNLTSAITDAFASIDQFKRGKNKHGEPKSGLWYEKTLISDNLSKEFSEEEARFLESIIYPVKNNKFEVDDAFGIFIGYEVTIDQKDKLLPTAQFRTNLRSLLKQQLDESTIHIIKKIEEFGLQGHSFYIYVLPFTNLDINRKAILKEVLE